jgi:hypothetical protein
MQPRYIAVTTLLLLAPLAACTSDASEADPLACKATMADLYEAGTEEDTEGKLDAACAGIDDKTLKRFAREIIAEQPTDRTKDLDDYLDDEPTIDIEQEIEDVKESLLEDAENQR